MFIKAIDKVDDIVIIHICKRFYIINNLKVNILIDINILRTEDIDLKFFTDEMIFINYKNIMISIQVWYENNILYISLSI